MQSSSLHACTGLFRNLCLLILLFYTVASLITNQAYQSFENPVAETGVEVLKFRRSAAYNLSTYPYCLSFGNQTDSGTSVETGRQLSSFYRQPLRCTVLDADTGATRQQSSALITTHRLIKYQTCFDPAIQNGYWNLTQSGALPAGCLGSFSESLERDYNAGIEDFVIHIRFGMVAPTAIRQGGSRSVYEGTADEMYGNMVDEVGRTVGQYSTAWNHYFNLSW